MEVYCLNDAANLSIPQDIREQFHRDENGRILFFTAPPLDALPPYKEGAAVGHSVRYLAARARRQEALRGRRKREAEEQTANAEAIKKVKLEKASAFKRTVEDLTNTAEGLLEQQLARATEQQFQAMYLDDWENAMRRHLTGLEGLQKEVQERNKTLEMHERVRKEDQSVSMMGKGILIDEVA